MFSSMALRVVSGFALVRTACVAALTPGSKSDGSVA
jgi:hypothetical protein